jgi:AraC family transcriptional regulator
MDDAPHPSSRLLGDPLERAMAHVEANAFEPLSLDALAAVAGLSPYHFARQFNARFGLTPMAFVRARRLGLAAKRLTAGEDDSLVELAFDAGFETQEGFTRAFKRAFGISPGRYRRARNTSPGKGPAMTDAAAAPPLTMHPGPRREAGFRTAGYAAVFDESNKAGIPALWTRLAPRLPIPGQAGGRTYGVMWATDQPGGGFHYQASVALEPGAAIPDAFAVKDVPAQTYLVFRHELDGSELHPQMQAAVREIWGVRLPACGHKLARGPDLEVYPADFDPARAGGWVEWWIPIEA